ncbi:hypothetical protein [Arcicella rigui]|uniref:Uncharacterized protein n=1 Tax=Arcicella rigui TaxID=797020 RepID=A0ABU5QAQ6_9BACT|nr:hypothetical protein [Arcicella rigui]MEA5139662.1 hypothetical protein [Arcicella rigui]
MKYKLYNKIEILDFNVSSQELNYVSKSEKLFFRDKVMIENVSIAGYFLDKCYFFYGDRTGKKVFNTETKKDIYIGHVSPHYQTYNGREIIANEYVDLITYEKKLIVLDLITFSKKTIRKDIDFGVRVRYQNQLIINIGKTTLKSLSLTSGTYLWESDLSEYCKILSVSNEPAQGMIRQVFGVWRDKLWVGFDGNQYASLDFLTGKVLQYFKLEDIDEIFQEVNALSPYFDGNNGLLCFLENRIYAEINLNTLRVERKKNFVTDNTETDWNFSSNTFSESHVYFVATRTSSRFSPNYVGVFDRATMEVVWSKDLELYKLPPVKNMPARFLAQAPQSDGDKLYVLDTHGTLHVFEKIEENEYSQA